ncbi:MAG TPA: tetratricopeptide repeat protein [Candidatus Krumholzibacteria bacterium]|nr:tetratricopeptide repeat protein [Candidatus Krumholzibacteria bacterium]
MKPALVLALVMLATMGAAPDRAAVQANLESEVGLPERARAVLFTARSQVDEGDPAAAAQSLQTWLDGGEGRDHALLRTELGAALLAAGRADEARIALRRAVAQEPVFGRAWLRLGEACYETGAFAEAADAFVRAHDLLPDPSPELVHYAGVCRLQAGDARGACDLLEPLVAADPQAPLPWIQALAAAALQAQAPGRARPSVQRLVSAHPDDPASWDLAWRFAAGSGDYRDAAVLLKASGFLAELDAAALDQLGALFAAAGVPLEAARAWAEALDRRAGAGPAPRDAVLRLARAWLAAHEAAQARRVLTSALASGEDAGLRALLGDAWLADGDHAPALDAYARAAGADPAAGRARLMAGWCALELGRTAEARRWLQEAVRFDAQAADARRLLKTLDGGT